MGRRELILIILAAAVVGCRGYERRPGPSSSSSTGTTRPADPFESSPAAPSSSESAGPTASTGSAATASTPARERPTDPFEDARRRIEEARNLPVPTGNYRVKVERIWFAESESSAIGAMLGYTDENWDVQVGAPAPDAGFRVGVAKGGFSAMLDGHMRSSKNTTREEAMLMMVADYPASLMVGKTRYFIPFSVGGIPSGLVVPEGQFVGTSLETICTPAGEGAVQVTLTPVFSGLGNGGSTVKVTQATTTVRVPLGHPFMMASHDQSADSVATALLSRRSSSGLERAVLILTVDGG